MHAAPPPPLGLHFGPEREMGEKVSEAREPVPRGCSSHGARTPAPAATAASSQGASSAESSSGSETLSEEGEPGGFCQQQPPPPGGALGPRPPAAWAPTRVVLELGVSAPPPPGGAAPPEPRGSGASQEEQDEEVGTAFPHLGPSGLRLSGEPCSPPTPGRWAGFTGAWMWGGTAGTLSRARVMTGTSLWVSPGGCHLRVCVCLHMLPGSMLLKC